MSRLNMTLADKLIPALCNEFTYCKSIECTRAQQMKRLFDSMIRQCRRLFLDQATAVACVPGPTWMVMLFMAVREENTIMKC
jgi:hypothetical protein